MSRNVFITTQWIAELGREPGSSEFLPYSNRLRAQDLAWRESAFVVADWVRAGDKPEGGEPWDLKGRAAGGSSASGRGLGPEPLSQLGLCSGTKKGPAPGHLLAFWVCRHHSSPLGGGETESQRAWGDRESALQILGPSRQWVSCLLGEMIDSGSVKWEQLFPISSLCLGTAPDSSLPAGVPSTDSFGPFHSLHEGAALPLVCPALSWS